MTRRLGLVGCGNVALAHSFSLKAILKAGLADAQVVATFDTDPARAESFARNHDGCVAVAAVDDLLDGVDAVWVCTPTATHRAIVEAAAARGLAVFCEKPIGPTLADAEATAAAVARAGVPNQVGLVLRTSPVFLALRDVVASGALGPVMTAVFRDDQFFPIQGSYNSTWRADVTVAGAGTLLEHSIHDLDVLRFCLGEITGVAARTANFAGHEGIEDVATVLLEFASGGLATLTSVWHEIQSRPSTRRLEVIGRDGMAWLDDDFLGPLHVETSDGARTVEVAFPEWVDGLPGLEADVFLPVKHYASANRAFLDALAAGVAPSPGFDDALVAHRLAAAVYESAEADGTPGQRVVDASEPREDG